MPIGVGAGKPRGDLGAIDRPRHHAEGVIKRGKIEAGEVKHLSDLGIGQQRFQMWRIRGSTPVLARSLDDNGAAIAIRQLHDAKPVAVRIESHGLGIDGHRVGVAGEIWQVAAMLAYGHRSGPRDGDVRIGPRGLNLTLNLPRGERPRAAFVSKMPRDKRRWLKRVAEAGDARSRGPAVRQFWRLKLAAV